MLRKKTAVMLCVVGSIFYGRAQESKIYTHDQKDYQKAVALYNNHQYQAAQTIFEKVKSNSRDMEMQANSAYYAANAAIRLNQLGADRLMEDFVEGHPTSTKRNTAYMDVADYYFETGKYPNALKWYSKVEKGALSRKETERFNFNMGYCLFSTKKPKEAEQYFNLVTTSVAYGAQAKYYMGYIAYEQDDFAGATQRFDQIIDQDILEEKLSYYQADMNFKLGNFYEAIALAKKQLTRADRTELSELNKIIGESYFNLKQYGNAIPYLEAYKGKKGKWNNTDYYLLGYSHYQQGDYAKAVQQFNKIIDGNSSVSQNAYYHLAECYLKLDKKQEALNAFRNASQMDFSADIQKDANLNYARLSYEIGNAYESVPKVLTDYLEKYPNDKNKEEMQALLVDSYITSRNFKGALELLESNRNYASKATYQKVAYYRGVELYIDNNFEAASAAFQKSLDNADNPSFKARASYWKAEADYANNRYEDALAAYLQFKQNSAAKTTPEYKDIDYNLAYTYFKLRDYNNAITYFNRYGESTATEAAKLQDSYLRLGDSYFVSSKYWPALETYNKAIAANGPEKDYAAFQKALCYGFIGRGATKIEELDNFISRYPNSKLNDDALFELGNSYVRENNTEKGLQSYDKLIQNYKGSSLVPQAMLRQGLVHYNANRNEQALAKFKTVVRDYANTQEALQAVTTAKLIYVDLGRVNEYAQWVQGLDFVAVTDVELDNATFESAEKQFLEGKNDAAIRGYESYLKEFPKGLNTLKANFNLAQLYFGKNDKEKALPYFKKVADNTANEYTEQALTRVCEIYVGKDDYLTAIPYLKLLEAKAEIQQNVTFAQSNLMKGYYEQSNYDKTIEYAGKVLATSKIDDRIKSDAQIMIARSAIKTNNEPKAQKAYGEVLKIAKGALAAEALYYDGYFKNKAGDFEGSNLAVQKLAKDYAGYKEWSAKGLLLMAKNFYALGDAFQATYILDSVIANFSEFPKVVEEAKRESSLMKAKEAKRNSSINPEGN